MSLQGKTALITGSTSGIGLAMARGFAKEGVNIIMNGLGDLPDLEKKRNQIEQTGIKVIYHGADMTRPDEITSLVEEAIKEFGGVDILINNAGIQYVSPIEEFPPEKWDAIIAINLSASFHTIRHALPRMKERGWGRIINMASSHALVASPHKSAYIAAKHGLLGLTKTVALEVAQDGVTCNAICPGYVMTDLVKNQIPNTMKARNMTEEQVMNEVLLATSWTKKFTTTEQLLGTALFLCSEHAENITGTNITLDGGWATA